MPGKSAGRNKEASARREESVKSASPARRLTARILGVFSALTILVAASAISFYLIAHKPRAARQPPEPKSLTVEAMPLRLIDHRVTVKALGTVIASQRVELTSRLGGEIVRISPELLPGGRFKTGEAILQIDPTDYQLTVRQLESNVAQTQYELKLELGRQAVARREYELLGETLREQDREMVLRAPQLNAAHASRAAAEAALERARLDLQRTRVTAPFNAVVQKKLVGIGSQVNAGTVLVILVDTDEYWVEVSMPMDRIRWIDIPRTSSETGSPVRIRHDAAWPPGAYRKGRVVRLMTDLEPEGRMARLVVAVKDPFSLREANRQNPRLTLGAYVRVEIEGKVLPRVARIPRSSLRGGNRIWVMTKDRTLDFRQVKILWNESDHVFIADKLGKNEFLITSDLAAPVRGMRLRTAADSPTGPSPRPRSGAKGTGER